MRNLKKVLSLSLAFVMLLGMMVVGGSAATYNDVDDVNNVEAVEILSAIGVFNGDENNDFNPAGDLTREQAAKIITYMLMGKTNADKLGTTSAPYSDVAADRWSAGSVAYCSTLGIIAGNGDGTFAPNANVTGYAFAKMLLVALGYDAKIQGYVGSDWSINVAKDAMTAGLTNGVTVSSNNLTREEAAQMAFNALTATLVEYDNKGTEITTGDMSIVVGASKPENVTSTTLDSVNNIDNNGGDVQFAERYHTDLVRTVTANDDAVNGIGDTTWTLDGKPVLVLTNDANHTFTTDMTDPITGKANKTLNKLLKNVDCALAAAYVTVDGATGSALTDIDALAALTGDGVLVEVYTYVDSEKDVYLSAVTVTNEVLAQITNVRENKDGIKTFQLTEKSNNGYAINDVTFNKAEDADNSIYDALCGYEKDDYVLLTVNKAGTSYDITSVATPDTVVGVNTKLNDDSTVITLDGVACKAGANYAVGTVQLGKSVTVYLDTYGNFLYANLSPDENATIYDPSVLFICNTWIEGSGKNVANWFEGVTVDGTVITAKFVDASGTGEGIYKGDSTSIGATATVSSVNKAVEYKYDEEKDIYVLHAATNATDAIGVLADLNVDSDVEVEDVTSNVTKSDLKLAGLYYAEDVKFIFVDSKTTQASKVQAVSGVCDLLTKVTGVATGLTETQDYAVVSLDESGNYVISAVFVSSAEAAKPAPEKQEGIIYVLKKDTYVDTILGEDGKTALYSYEGWVDGEATKFYTTANTQNAGFYTYTLDAKTGAWNLADYSATAPAAELAAETISAVNYVNGKYYITTSTLTGGKFDATDAVVVDTTNKGMDSLKAITGALNDGDTVTIVALYTNDTTKNIYTVEYIYVVGYTPYTPAS